MKILALDTSTERLSVALLCHEQILTYEDQGGAFASTRLLPAVNSLVKQAGLELCEIEIIAFANGPGAFSGLRTACSTSQGLAVGLGCPVITVDSLLIVAQDAILQHNRNDSSVIVVMDARLNEVYAGVYHFDGNNWLCLNNPALYNPTNLVSELSDIISRLPNLIWAGSGVNLVCHPSISDYNKYATESNRSLALGKSAFYSLLNNQTLDPSLALPIYVRDKVALTITERKTS